MALTEEQTNEAIKKLIALGYKETKNKKALYKFYAEEKIKFTVFFPYKNLQKPYATELNKEGFLNLKQLEGISTKFFEDAEKLKEL